MNWLFRLWIKAPLLLAPAAWTARTVAIAALLTMMFAAPNVTASAQPEPPSRKTPTLSETLQWLSGASDAESGNGNQHITFESDPRNACSVTITETRVKAGPNFWIKLSFSLADIDPMDIRTEDLTKPPLPQPGEFAVSFHTTNYTKKIIHTSSNYTEPISVSDYNVFTNDWFAPRFARAFKHAVELCGGKQSSF